MAAKPFSSTEPGGMFAYIDKFQAIVAELEVIDPTGYTDRQKKMTLLTNIRHAEGISHLVQKCRDEYNMSFDDCAAYIRQNAMFIDKIIQGKTPARLLHVHERSPEPNLDPEQKSVDEVSRLFHSMATEEGLEQTYQIFSTKTFRQSLSIPDVIWNELEPMLKDKINEIRAKVRENRKQKEKPKSEKLPNQYPSMKTKETLANLVSSVANLGLDDFDNETDDDMMVSSVFMARTFLPVDPPEMTSGPSDPPETSDNTPEPLMEVKAHFEYSMLPKFQDKVYAISDGGGRLMCFGQVC